MATRTGVPTYAPNGHRQLVVVVWTGLLSGDVGDAFEVPGWADRSVQIEATFGDGTITMQGSNDGVTFYPLTDPQGNAIAKTANALEQIEEVTRYVRPSFSGTTGTAGVVTLVGRRTP
jgi:hypothetical protein